MEYVIEIVIPWAEIGCNPGTLVIQIETESKSGIKKLKKYLQGKFGEDRVTVWRDITDVQYEEV